MIRTLVLALGMSAVAVTALPIAARADDGWRDRREWHERHGWREHERHEWCEHHPRACGVPGYVYGYAPPPVVYAPPPPPPIVYAPPSLSVVIPLHIR